MPQASAGQAGEAAARQREQLKNQLVATARRFKHRRPLPPSSIADLSETEVFALIVICHACDHSPEVRPSQIAKRFNASPSSVSQLLKSLEEKGFIERTRCKSDSRAVVVDITEQGKVVSEEMRAQRSRFFDGMFDAVGEEEIACFIATLSKICDYIDSSGDFEECELSPAPFQGKEVG